MFYTFAGRTGLKRKHARFLLHQLKEDGLVSTRTIFSKPTTKTIYNTKLTALHLYRDPVVTRHDSCHEAVTAVQDLVQLGLRSVAYK
jgi:hypothetical protein